MTDDPTTSGDRFGTRPATAAYRADEAAAPRSDPVLERFWETPRQLPRDIALGAALARDDRQPASVRPTVLVGGVYAVAPRSISFPASFPAAAKSTTWSSFCSHSVADGGQVPLNRHGQHPDDLRYGILGTGRTATQGRQPVPRPDSRAGCPPRPSPLVFPASPKPGANLFEAGTEVAQRGVIRHERRATSALPGGRDVDGAGALRVSDAGSVPLCTLRHGGIDDAVLARLGTAQRVGGGALRRHRGRHRLLEIAPGADPGRGPS